MKNDIIIFEGPDRCGKTEIAKNLADILDYQYFKNTEEHNNFKKGSFNVSIELKYITSLLSNIEVKGNGIIFDRFFISEYVYAKMYKRSLNLKEIKHYDSLYAKSNAKIIYCYKDKYRTYDDEIIDIKHINKIKKLYEQYFNKTEIKVFKLKTDDEDLINQLAVIISWLKNGKK